MKGNNLHINKPNGQLLIKHLIILNGLIIVINKSLNAKLATRILISLSIFLLEKITQQTNELPINDTMKINE